MKYKDINDYYLVDMVCEKLEATGFEVIEKNRDGEWNCIVAKLK